MTLRSAIKMVFGQVKNFVTSQFRELGGYKATFSTFGTNIYANEIVRACIRTLAEHTAKANVKVLRGGAQGDKKLEKMIQYRPNVFMNGKDFLYKIRTMYEINNVVFIYIMRDEFGRCNGLYPIPSAQYEAVEYDGRLYIKFRFQGGEIATHSWEDLAVLRKDYNSSDVWGDDNTAILTSLDLLSTTNEGMANAIKSTANLRGILKYTKAGIKDEDLVAKKATFDSQYMSIENASGVVALDSYSDYTPISLAPVTANYKSIEELRNNIYRYFGMNESIITSSGDADEREAFYEAKIEPFLLALSLELSNKVFTDRERGLNNEIMFESNRMSFMSIEQKLALRTMVDLGAMTPNEWRQALNLAPIEGGDDPIRRLDTRPTNEGSEPNANQDGQGVSGNEPVATSSKQEAE